ncbi:MAG: hypothetical protein ACYSSI_14720 [Planctomycetota bacterium]
MKIVRVYIILLLLCIAGYTNASIVELDFQRITSNAAEDLANQFNVIVSDPGDGKISFYFTNLGPVWSSVTRIYFHDTLNILQTPVEITNGPGVSFDTPAIPSNLPGGNNAAPPFVTTGLLSVQSIHPNVPENGIHPNTSNPNDWLTLSLSLQPGKTFQQLTNGLYNNYVRLGIHVQQIPDGDSTTSDSFIAQPATDPIPEPATILLLSLCAMMLRKKQPSYRESSTKILTLLRHTFFLLNACPERIYTVRSRRITPPRLSNKSVVS